MQGKVAAIVLATILSYVPLTIGVTEWRGRVRKRMNALDNDLGARATDMLLNYETVRFRQSTLTADLVSGQPSSSDLEVPS